MLAYRKALGYCLCTIAVQWVLLPEFARGETSGDADRKIDKQRLASRIKACESALKDGEYLGGNLGEWVAVGKMDSDWFKNLQDEPQTKFQNVILASVLLAPTGLVVVGLVATIR